MASYKKDINLLAVMTQRKSRINPLAVIIPIAVFLALGAGIFFGTIWYTTNMAELTFQRDDLKRYIESARVTNSQDNTRALRLAAEEMQLRANEVRETLYNLSSYPDLHGEQFQAIFDYAGDEIELSGYVYTRVSGTLSFSATSERVSRMPVFIQNLRESGLFSDVQYQGYVMGTRTESGTPVLDRTTDMMVTPTYTVTEYLYEVTCRVTTPTPALPPVDTDEGAENQEGSGE